MKFLSLCVAPLVLASTAAALPGNWHDWMNNNHCNNDDNNSGLTQDEANDIIAKFTEILEHTDVDASNVTAQALLADGFFEKSDSINTLAGFPVRSVAETECIHEN